MYLYRPYRCFSFYALDASVLQRVSVRRRLPPDRLQHRSDLRQVSSLFLEPGERLARQEARTVWGWTTRLFPHMLNQYQRAMEFNIWAQIQSYVACLCCYMNPSAGTIGLDAAEIKWCVCLFLCFLQKQEKPKFVLCVTFAENGDAITGDSSGNILVWGKGTIIQSFLQL